MNQQKQITTYLKARSTTFKFYTAKKWPTSQVKSLRSIACLKVQVELSFNQVKSISNITTSYGLHYVVTFQKTLKTCFLLPDNCRLKKFPYVEDKSSNGKTKLFLFFIFYRIWYVVVIFCSGNSRIFVSKQNTNKA